MTVKTEEIIEALKPVQDPELNRSIVELGMVKNVVIDGEQVTVEVLLTIAGCPLKAKIENDITLQQIAKRVENNPTTAVSK